MVGVIPLAVVFSARGIKVLIDRSSNRTFVRAMLYPILIIGQIILALAAHKVPVKLDPQHRILKEAAVWVKDSGLDEAKVYYHDLFFLHTLGSDPFDAKQCHEKLPNRLHPEEGLDPGSIIQWDAHYGPNEGEMPLERLLENPDFEVLKIFEPEQAFTVLGGHEYQVILFRRR